MVHTNIAELDNMPVGHQIVINNKKFTLEREHTSGDVYLINIEHTLTSTAVKHICCPTTDAVTFSRKELIERLLSGNYKIG